VTKTAVIAGATGAIGSRLLPLLLDSPDYARVIVLTRRPLGGSHPKLVELLNDYRNLPGLGDALRADDVYCCLGTTQKKSGKTGLEQVDHDYVIALAAAALTQGAQQFLVVSAIGASTGSPSFYSRIKGRMERAVSGLGYGSVHIVRPSLLLGEREESRPGEEFAQKLSPLLSPLLKGALRKYRPVDVAEVAAALLRLAQRGDRGVHIHYLPLPD
jgi:uncharacterized protein YbjT (DUF2867 family)